MGFHLVPIWCRLSVGFHLVPIWCRLSVGFHLVPIWCRLSVGFHLVPIWCRLSVGFHLSSNLVQVISGIPRSSNLVQAISGTSISAAVPCWNHQKRLSPVTGASFPAPGRAPISCQSLRLASRAKVRDCYVLTHSRNLHPHSQFGYCLLAHVGLIRAMSVHLCKQACPSVQPQPGTFLAASASPARGILAMCPDTSTFLLSSVQGNFAAYSNWLRKLLKTSGINYKVISDVNKSQVCIMV